MIRRANSVFPNFLKNNFIIKITDNVFVCGAHLDKKRRVKLKFSSCKTKTTIVAPVYCPDTNFRVSNNNALETSPATWSFVKKKKTYPFRQKIKWSFIKFKYRGKGFKVKKFNSKRKLTFRLGKSHWTKLLWNPHTLTVKRTKKNTYCCIGWKKKIFNNFLLIVKKIKGVNRYTKRGLRLSRQGVVKRFGKVSQGMSILNR